MGGGAWKVAYADFVTAMMAFFLLMWILNMSSPETKAALAGIFSGDLQFNSNQISPVGMSNNPLIQYAGDIKKVELKISEAEKTDIQVSSRIRQFLLKDALPTGSSGLTSDGIGVLLHLTPEVMFEPGTVTFSEQGKQVLAEVGKVLSMYKMYLVVRGHADSSEKGNPLFPSLWDLSGARANAAIRYLLELGVDPKFLRSVSYADTRPAVPPSDPDAARKNGRIEFHFHRPEVMSTVVGY